MTFKQHIRMTASEIAMGRYMRAPDHPSASAPDEFAAAFDSFKVDDKPAEPAPAEPALAAAAEPAPAEPAPAEPAPAEPAPAAPAEPAPAEPAPAEPAPAEPAPAEPAAATPADTKEGDAILKRLAGLVADQPAPAEPAPASPEAQPLYSAEEQAKVDDFIKEWPEAAEAMDLRLRPFGRALLSYAFEQIKAQYDPVRELVEAMAGRAHIADLKGAIGEYTDAERDDVVGWVKQQPTYLQTAMMSVIEEGTVAEVADLFNRYREATGKVPAPAPVAPGGEIELSSEAKKAAAALAPVESKRPVVPAGEDMSNYDAAFVQWKDKV